VNGDSILYLAMAVEAVAAELLMPLLAIPHQQVADAVAAE
jgi:hypothetical protein